jgi:hypothetical protein
MHPYKESLILKKVGLEIPRCLFHQPVLFSGVLMWSAARLSKTSILFAVRAETMIGQGRIFRGYGSPEDFGDYLQGFGVLGSDPFQSLADLIGPDRVIATPR